MLRIVKALKSAGEDSEKFKVVEKRGRFLALIQNKSKDLGSRVKSLNIPYISGGGSTASPPTSY